MCDEKRADLDRANSSICINFCSHNAAVLREGISGRARGVEVRILLIFMGFFHSFFIGDTVGTTLSIVLRNPG